jgi:hypothetical protein
MMEAESTSETSVSFNQSTRRYIPEGCHLYSGPQTSTAHSQAASRVQKEVPETRRRLFNKFAQDSVFRYSQYEWF